MSLIINATEGARLKELDDFSKMLTDEYLSDVRHPQTSFIFNQFFNINQDPRAAEKLRLLNISYSIPSILCDKFADYVGQPLIPFDVSLEDFISTYIWGGYATFNCRMKDGEFLVDLVDPQEYILNGDGSERVLTFLDDYDDRGRLRQYVLVQRINGPNIQNDLYKLSHLGGAYELHGEKVPLSSHYATEGMLDTEILTIDSSPVVVVNNKKINNKLYGTSELKKIRSLISSLEIEVINIQDNFLKHLSSILALPASRLKTNEDGNVEINSLKAIAMEAGDTLPAYIMNTNPLIRDSFLQIEGFLRQICAIASIPDEFMALKSQGGAESADAKKIRLTSFIKKVEKIRAKFEVGLRAVDAIRMQMTEEKDENFMIVWPEIFPADKEKLALELSTAQDANLISNKKSIMRYQDLSEEDALAEREQILSEKQTISSEDLGL